MSAPKYGPHDPDTAPDTVAVLQAGRWFRVSHPRTIVEPRPPALIRQRQQLNTRAADYWPCTCGLWHNKGMTSCPNEGVES